MRLPFVSSLSREIFNTPFLFKLLHPVFLTYPVRLLQDCPDRKDKEQGQDDHNHESKSDRSSNECPEFHTSFLEVDVPHLTVQPPLFLLFKFFLRPFPELWELLDQKTNRGMHPLVQDVAVLIRDGELVVECAHRFLVRSGEWMMQSDPHVPSHSPVGLVLSVCLGRELNPRVLYPGPRMRSRTPAGRAPKRVLESRIAVCFRERCAPSFSISFVFRAVERSLKKFFQSFGGFRNPGRCSNIELVLVAIDNSLGIPFNRANG